MFNFCMIHAIPLIFRAFRKKKKKGKSYENKIVPVLQIRLYNFFLYFYGKIVGAKSIYTTELFLVAEIYRIFVSNFFPLFAKGSFFFETKVSNDITYYISFLYTFIDDRSTGRIIK